MQQYNNRLDFIKFMLTILKQEVNSFYKAPCFICSLPLILRLQKWWHIYINFIYCKVSIFLVKENDAVINTMNLSINIKTNQSFSNCGLCTWLQTVWRNCSTHFLGEAGSSWFFWNIGSLYFHTGYENECSMFLQNITHSTETSCLYHCVSWI